jgi:ribonuclease III
MDEERRASLRELEAKLGHHFHDLEWLDKALTHKSYVHEVNHAPADHSDKEGNEVLEFLGDSVLNLAVGHLLLQEFPEAHEGILSQKRAHLVKKAFLSSLSRQLRLQRFLRLGKGEMQSGGRMKASILANTYEAVLGALYLDSGFERALEVVRRHLEPYFQAEALFHGLHDYKSILQEQMQRTHGLSPQYEVVEEFGPDHDKRFQISVIIGGEVKGIGWGKSKKEAEQEAAQKALEDIGTQSQREDDK